MTDTLDRFLKAQEHTYPAALCEIRSGRKESHWMWFIFPQMRRLGMSDMAYIYGITADYPFTGGPRFGDSF